MTNPFQRRRLWPHAARGLAAVLLYQAGFVWAQFNSRYGGTAPFPVEPEPSVGSTVGSRILAFIIGAAIGSLIGAFFSDRLRAFRRWLLIALIASVVLFAIGFHSATAGVGGAIVGGILAWWLLRDAPADEARRRDTTLGSAEWATPDYLRAHGLLGGDPIDGPQPVGSSTAPTAPGGTTPVPAAPPATGPVTMAAASGTPGTSSAPPRKLYRTDLDNRTDAGPDTVPGAEPQNAGPQGAQVGQTSATPEPHPAARPSPLSPQVVSPVSGRHPGLFLGLVDDPANPQAGPQRLVYRGDRHLLTVAPTRTGKGVTAIVPNLLSYPGSAVVIDPKGENALITAARRGQGRAGLPGLGQAVHVVDPWNITGGITGLPVARFNPLDWIGQDRPNATENAMILAESIVPQRSGKGDSFWDDEARSLLVGLLLHVALHPAEDGRRHLGRVRDLIVADERGLAELFAAMITSGDPVAASTAARTVSKEDKLRSNVLASLQSHTHFLDSPAIRESLSATDFRFEDLKTRPATVYLVLPADRLDAFGRWLRLLVQQAITVNARNIAQKPAMPVLFLLDEMAALGRLAMVEQAFGLMAGFGLQLWGIVQDTSQLKRIYDDGWETFIGNAGVVQYFGSRDHRTAEYFSKLCGVTTIEKISITQAITQMLNRKGEEGGSSSSTSTTRDVVQRQLAYPDELMVMKSDAALVFVENLNPIRAKKLAWFADPKRKPLGADLQATRRNA